MINQLKQTMIQIKSNIPDHPYKILIIGSSRLGKTNVLLNLIKQQRPDIDKIYLYVKDPFKSKLQLLINGRETDDVYKNLEDYNPT